MLTAKNLNDIELEIKNRDKEVMMQAMAHQKLKERYKKLKWMDNDEIVKENIEKIRAELKKKDSLIDYEDKDEGAYWNYSIILLNLLVSSSESPSMFDWINCTNDSSVFV